MLLPCALIKLSCLTAISCCAMTAPTPSNQAPSTTTVRSIAYLHRRERRFQTTPRSSLARAAAYPGRIPGPASYSPAPKISETVPTLMLADCNPDPLGGRGHIDMIDFVFTPQPLDNRIDDRRTGADRAGLARALDAQRIGLAGNVMGFEHE